MIAEFIGKMVPPAATVTAEKAKTEDWVDRVHSIGTLVAIEGVDVRRSGGMVVDYFFDSGKDVEKGAKLVKLDTSVEEADSPTTRRRSSRPSSTTSASRSW